MCRLVGHQGNGQVLRVTLWAHRLECARLSRDEVFPYFYGMVHRQLLSRVFSFQMGERRSPFYTYDCDHSLPHRHSTISMMVHLRTVFELTLLGVDI